MSFLSQLRQSQPQPVQKTNLCYLFEIERVSQSLSLRFTLAELKAGKLIEEGKSYQIQRQHLQHAPPFLGVEDVKILNELCSSDERWFSQSRGRVPEAQHRKILTAMVKSERLFCQTRDGNWQKFVLGEPVKVNLNWARETSGNYKLNWASQSQSTLVSLGGELQLPVSFDLAASSLSFVDHGLSDSALMEVTDCDHSLTVSKVGEFISAKHAAWSSLNLPLPCISQVSQVEAALQPVLRLHTRSNVNTSGGFEDLLSLEFRYSGQDYCTQIFTSADEFALDYWTGDCVNRLQRNCEKEASYLESLKRFLSEWFDMVCASEWQTEDVDSWKVLLTEKRDQVESLGFQVQIDPGFRYHYVVADNWLLGINQDDASHLELRFTAQIDGEQQSLFELLSQLQDFNLTQQLILNDGRILLLPQNTVSGIMAELGDLLKDSTSIIKLPRSQFNRLQKLQENIPEQTEWQGAVELKDLANSLYQTPKLLEKISDGVNAELRPYQWLGVCWFHHLKHHKINGLLADDMGLGKTLQTLTHLSLEKSQGELKQPALIVAPTSLLHNWAAEIRKFTPHLKYKIIHGTKRNKSWCNLEQYNILITSYQLVINDLTLWKQQKLSWVILDEAQVIKNSRTKARQALCELVSEHRLCLSGTPVENHLGELWSLLDFLMPGVLGTQNEFRQLYQKPIEQHADENRMSQLKHRIAPFMLRRTKEQVAPDLPKKTIIEQHIDLFDEQRDFYESQKESTQAELQQQLEDVEHGGQRQMLLLSALMKLRQVCCDPALVGEAQVKSAKRQHCIEMVEELVAENRSILIFSQFTSMLSLLAEDLKQLNIPFLKLTGQSQNRQKLVEQFQNGDYPVFLISLKAGGVGLNLTRADTVIHYDPWWNSAAEQQATDRAHRIGQDKPVFVYKLISENTIEQKIAELQKHKAQISEHINHQAQVTGEKFALKLEDLMSLWNEELK